jgi:hypothetical protein
MQALSLKSAFGWLWIRAGWRIFRTQPFRFVLLFIICWMLIAMASEVAALFALPFGSPGLAGLLQTAAVVIFSPALSVGFMQACRDASGPSGTPANPLTLFAPFRAGGVVVRQLLLLGVFKFLVLAVALAATPDEPTPVAPTSATTASVNQQPSATAPASPSATTPQSESEVMAQANTMFRQAAPLALIYLVLELLVWYAPVLVAWHGLSAVKSIFFSVVAVWRNLGAFAVYVVGWVAIWFLLSIPASLAASLVGMTRAAVIAFPLALLFMTWISCSKYPSYESVFVEGKPKDDPAPIEP